MKFKGQFEVEHNYPSDARLKIQVSKPKLWRWSHRVKITHLNTGNVEIIDSRRPVEVAYEKF